MEDFKSSSPRSLDKNVSNASSTSSGMSVIPQTPAAFGSRFSVLDDDMEAATTSSPSKFAGVLPGLKLPGRYERGGMFQKMSSTMESLQEEDKDDLEDDKDEEKGELENEASKANESEDDGRGDNHPEITIGTSSSSVVSVTPETRPDISIIDAGGKNLRTGVEETITRLRVEETSKDNESSDSDKDSDIDDSTDVDSVIENVNFSIETIVDELVDEVSRRSSSSSIRASSGNTNLNLESDSEDEEPFLSLKTSTMIRSRSFEELSSFWSQQDLDDISAKTPATKSRSKRKASPGISPEDVKSRKFSSKRRKSSSSLNVTKRSYFTALSNIMSVQVSGHGNMDLMMPGPRQVDDEQPPTSPRSELRSILNAIHDDQVYDEEHGDGAQDTQSQ